MNLFDIIRRDNYRTVKTVIVTEEDLRRKGRRYYQNLWASEGLIAKDIRFNYETDCYYVDLRRLLFGDTLNRE